MRKIVASPRTGANAQSAPTGGSQLEPFAHDVDAILLCRGDGVQNPLLAVRYARTGRAVHFDRGVGRAGEDLDDGFQRKHGIADAEMVVHLTDVGCGRNGASTACLGAKSPDEESLRGAERRKLERS